MSIKVQFENLKKVNADFEKEFQDQFMAFLNSGRYILGEEVNKFETAFASYNQSGHCIGVGNGTDALTISLKAAISNLKGEIIVPSNTYIATILPIINLGMTPVLVEPDILSYNIDPEKIEEKISHDTRAVIITHMYGKPCQMDKILHICEKYNVPLIEDCAHAHGAEYRGIKVGNFGLGAFSFYPTKNLGALGDAGGITCDDVNINNKARALRNYGSSIKNQNDIVGYNSRLDELQAGFLTIKLRNLDNINQHKEKLAEAYFEALKDKFLLPIKQKAIKDVFHIFPIRHEQRDRLRSFLLKNGIETEIHYPKPPHKQPALENVIKGDYPISEEIHNTILSLPISYSHTLEDINFVCEILNKF